MFLDPVWIASAFTLANSVRALFYVPQIVAVARSVNGARDIALSTWGLWALTNLLGVAYAAVVAHDGLLALSFAASALGCVITIALTLFKRAQYRRTQAWNLADTHQRERLSSQARSSNVTQT